MRASKPCAAATRHVVSGTAAPLRPGDTGSPRSGLAWAGSEEKMSVKAVRSPMKDREEDQAPKPVLERDQEARSEPLTARAQKPSPE